MRTNTAYSIVLASCVLGCIAVLMMLPKEPSKKLQSMTCYPIIPHAYLQSGWRLMELPDRPIYADMAARSVAEQKHLPNQMECVVYPENGTPVSLMAELVIWRKTETKK